MEVSADSGTVKAMKLLPQALAILELAARGRTDKEIAQEVGLSIHTVDYHWRHIRNRYGLSSRTAIVARYLAAPPAVEERAPLQSPDFALLRSWPS
jgi:LuxR family maltose regulon positive regulatory protein/two-component system response regulator NreC